MVQRLEATLRRPAKSSDDARTAAISSLLLVVSIASLLLVLGLLTLQVWLKAIICLCEGQFIRCGFCLCLGILPVNLFFGSGESYTPLYITIMVLALAAAIGKFYLRWRQHRPETAPGGPTLPPPFS